MNVILQSEEQRDSPLQHLRNDAEDDEARAGLGVIQFLQSFEHLGASLHKYGLRTERAFRGAPPEIGEVLPQNPNPETILAILKRPWDWR